jgi:hypothetical protein
LKHDANTVEIVLRRHVEHRVVFVIKASMRLGIFEVAFHEVTVKIPV